MLEKTDQILCPEVTYLAAKPLILAQKAFLPLQVLM